MGSEGIMPPEGVLSEADLLQGGANELDGDRVGISWVPANYTPTTAPAEVDDASQLTAHLAGIDAQIISATNSVLDNVRNESGFDIDKGTLLTVVGYSVPESRTLVDLADKDVEGSAAVLWANEDILNNTNGVGLKVGEIANVDTSAFSIGQLLGVGNAGAAIAEVDQGLGFTGHFQGVGAVTKVGVGDGRIMCHVGNVDAVHDTQYDALLGTSGTPSNTNRYVTNADARIPTQDENNALVGTQGAPSTANKYVTNDDKRLGPTLSATATLDDTTASLTDVMVAGMQITLAAGQDGDYVVEFSSSVENTNNSRTQEVVLYAGGTPTIVAESERRAEDGAGQAVPVHCLALVTGLVATDTIEAHWRTSGNTATMHERVLIARRVG